MTEYKISSLKDLLSIPLDRIDDCLDELKDGLKLMHTQMAALEISMDDAVFDSFTWKDDGAKDVTSNAHFLCGGVVQVKIDRGEDPSHD